MSKDCMYCEHHDVFPDDKENLHWLCTHSESENFMEETDCLDSCDKFEEEYQEEADAE